MNRIIELQNGSAMLRVAPGLGARVTRCMLETRDGSGVDILHPYPEHHTDLDAWAKGGIYPLIPYSGRIAQARLHVGNDVRVLRPHPDAAPHSLHGNAHRCSWTVESQSATELQLRLDQDGNDDWPWAYQARLGIALERRRLRIDVALTNRSRSDMPAGIGIHPYLCCDAETQMQTSASHQWRMTPDQLPTTCYALEPQGELAQENAGPLPGFLAPPRGAGRSQGWGHAQLHALGDTEQTVFLSNWARMAWLRFGRSHGLAVRASETLDHLVLHRPAAAPYVCLEPQSHVPDGFNLAWRGVANTGARILPPGGRLAGQVFFALTGALSPKDDAP